MPDEDLQQPHDKLFKEGFSDPANAAALLRQHLPAEVAALIHWDQLQLIPGSFLDEDLRHSHTDLLFSAPLAADPESSVCVHLLFEHQSTRDPFISLRLLRYMVRIWEEWIRLFGSSKPLPVIFPVVLAQHRRIWKLSTQFSALFGKAASLDFLRPFLPDFAFRLIQLAAIPFDAIRGTPDGIFVLRVLKAEPIGRLLGNAVWDNNLLAYEPVEKTQTGSAARKSSTRRGATTEKVETFDCGATKLCGIGPAARRGSLLQTHGAAAHPTTADPGSAAGPGFSTGSYVSRRIFERFIPYIFARTDPIDRPQRLPQN